MNTRVTIDDSATQKALKQLIKSTELSVKREIRRAAVSTRSIARKAAPHASGELKGSIQERFEDDGLVGIVTASAMYAPFVEGVFHNYTKGRAPGRWPPRAPILRWVQIRGLPVKWFGSDTVEHRNAATFLVRRKIGRRGTRAQPFMKPAIAIEGPKFEKNMERIFKQAAEASGFLLGGSK